VLALTISILIGPFWMIGVILGLGLVWLSRRWRLGQKLVATATIVIISAAAWVADGTGVVAMTGAAIGAVVAAVYLIVSRARNGT
jgi:hypothetical protein